MNEADEKRDKRGKSLAAMGLVERHDDRFKVKGATLRGSQGPTHDVHRDKETSKVMCNCNEFAEQFMDDNHTAFRCEHIWAVKYALLNKSFVVVSQPSEPAKTAQTPQTAPGSTQAGPAVDTAGWEVMCAIFRLPSGTVEVQFNLEKANSLKDEDKPDYWIQVINSLYASIEQITRDFKVKPDEGFPADPVARSLSDLVTAKQLGMIKALSRELELDPDEECAVAMDCKIFDLSKKAASALIKHLQEKQSAQQ